MLKKINAALLALSIGITSGCASAPDLTSALTSPYFKPSEGVTYAYGDFCGALLPDPKKFPAPVGQNVEARIAFLRAKRAGDYLDQACKTHDLCYEYFGHDNEGCDRVFFVVVNASGAGAGGISARCMALGLEMGSGVIALKDGKAGILDGSMAALTGLMSSVTNATGSVQQRLNAMVGGDAKTLGWAEPGECQLSSAQLTNLYSSDEVRQAWARAAFPDGLNDVLRGYEREKEFGALFSPSDLMGLGNLTQAEVRARMQRFCRRYRDIECPV